jgi:hypothetical protein
MDEVFLHTTIVHITFVFVLKRTVLIVLIGLQVEALLSEGDKSNDGECTAEDLDQISSPTRI